jgi:molybdenum cofactor cytidylyltransferase
MIEFVGILLAAGSAQRFGAPKLLQPLQDDIPIAVTTASTLLRALPNTIAVVRPGDFALIEAVSQAGLQIVENPLADEGMGTSLAAGVNATAGAGGWLIALADMPWVQPVTIAALVDRMQDGASMVAPMYAGQRGNPVGFSSQWFQPLRGLSGDKGARDLLVKYADELELLDVKDAGVLKDIDHPQDLYR